MTGLVVLRLAGTAAPGVIARRARDALAETPPGRFLCVLWQVPLAWTDEAPVEAIVAEALLGPPSARREDAAEDVMLHANLVVRSYGEDRLLPCRCFQLLVLRRAGPTLRARLKDAAGAPAAAARIDTTRPAFTRDWANNVWHLQDGDAEARIIARLSRLLCWPDEAVLVCGPDGHQMHERLGEAGRGDLVGVPERYPLAPPAGGGDVPDRPAPRPGQVLPSAPERMRRTRRASVRSAVPAAEAGDDG